MKIKVKITPTNEWVIIWNAWTKVKGAMKWIGLIHSFRSQLTIYCWIEIFKGIVISSIVLWTTRHRIKIAKTSSSTNTRHRVGSRHVANQRKSAAPPMVVAREAPSKIEWRRQKVTEILSKISAIKTYRNPELWCKIIRSKKYRLCNIPGLNRM